MGRIAITGATGFIGGTVAAVLAERGDDIRCLVRRDPGGDFPWPFEVVDPTSTESSRRPSTAMTGSLTSRSSTTSMACMPTAAPAMTATSG